jgi:hypothetical protein
MDNKIEQSLNHLKEKLIEYDSLVSSEYKFFAKYFLPLVEDSINSIEDFKKQTKSELMMDWVNCVMGSAEDNSNLFFEYNGYTYTGSVIKEKNKRI